MHGHFGIHYTEAPSVPKHEPNPANQVLPGGTPPTWNQVIQVDNTHPMRTSDLTHVIDMNPTRVRNCLDSHFAQIVCDKDGVVYWCIA